MLAAQRAAPTNMPGRTTEVKDSEWICRLVRLWLVRPGFVPPPEIRRLCDLTRLRKAQIRARPLDPAAREGAPRRQGQAHQPRVAGVLEIGARDARCRCSPGSPAPDQLTELAKARMRLKIRSCARRSPTAATSHTGAWSRNGSAQVVVDLAAPRRNAGNRLEPIGHVA
jgi:transposase